MDDLTPANTDYRASFFAEIDGATLLLEYAVAKGLAVPDALVLSIKRAEDWRIADSFPALEQRAAFAQAYRDLALLLAPVTADTLRNTSEDPRYGRRAFLMTWQFPLSEARIWSRKLSWITGIIAAVILFSENTNQVLLTFYPVAQDPAGAFRLWRIVSSILQSFDPFSYGALGSVVYLLRSAHIFIYERTFDKLRIPEYYNRMILGTIAGGAIKLLITEVSDDDGSVLDLSASALAFIAGYNSDFLFSAIERISAAILPKVTVESVKRVGPDGMTVAAMRQLLDRYATASDEEKKMLDKLLDKLAR
jgi:hypothetical protein